MSGWTHVFGWPQWAGAIWVAATVPILASED
jgi:hypothetical protein